MIVNGIDIDIQEIKANSKNNVEAIRKVRELTGARLIDAKNAVDENIESGKVFENNAMQPINNANNSNSMKVCKYCRINIPKEATICPNCKKKQTLNDWIVVLILIAVIFWGLKSCGNNNSKEPQQTNEEITVQRTKEAKKEDVKELQQKETAPKETENVKEEEKDKYYVGDTWKNKYVLVSYDECGEYTSDNQFIQPADGNKYIYVTFTFENVGKSDTTVAYWDFDCYADGYACEGAYLVGDGVFSQTLSSGRKIVGTIYYEVPKNASEIEFEYSPNFWTSEKIVFVYEE